MAAEQPGAKGGPGGSTPARLVQARRGFYYEPALTCAFSQRLLDSDGTQALDAYFATHHAPDAEAREAIVRFLSERSEVSD